MEGHNRGLIYFLTAVCLGAVLLVGCSGNPAVATTPGDGATTVTATAPAPTATPAPQSHELAQPQTERILEHVRMLAQEIGARPPGSAQENAAAQYIAAQLQSYGYEVELQSFPVAAEASRESLLAIRAPREEVFASVPLSLSASGKTRARLVAAGIGRPDQFSPASSGAVALVQRGELTFAAKVANAAAVGARAVVIFNNQLGLFLGSLPEASRIPVLAVSQAAGEALLAELARGPVDVEFSVGELASATSQNVIARSAGKPCETVSGGHYDSVPQAPGANDNASGTATVLEIARVLASNGATANHCFVLFGAEEVGLFGSKAYVSSLNQAARWQLKAMLNFDMVGVGDTWQLIGTGELQARAEQLAQPLGISVTRAGVAGTGAGSDHASFINAGLPALFLHRNNDPAWHTPEDALPRISGPLTQEIARLGIALLADLARS